MTVVSTSSSSTPFNFSSLPGKYAAAGSYSYTSTSPGNSNYTVLTSTALPVTISKAIISQTLISIPSSKFTYTGSSPLIKDVLSQSISPDQSGLVFELDNGSVRTGINFSAAGPLTSFIFPALPGKYAAVHSLVNYTYSVEGISNVNYTILPSGVLNVNITRAIPIITLNASLENFTYNSTAEKISGSVSSINGQVSGSLYVNGIREISPYSNATAGLYNASFITLKSQNYSAYSVNIVRQIYKASPNINVIVSKENFTYNGSADTFTGVLNSINNQLSVSSAKLYVNGLGVSNGYSIAKAGDYLVVYNTSGNVNYSAGAATKNINISKATPIMTITTSPSSNFSENGTDLNFYVSISTLNNQLIGTLYLNGTFVASTSRAITYNVGSAVGNYTALFSTPGDVNYTAYAITLSRAILSNIIKGLNLYINGIRNSNTSITYGTVSNFTAVYSPSSDFVEVYLNNTRVTPLRKGHATYSSTLPAGLYKITASTNISGVSNVTYYERINKATPTLTLSTTPSSNFTKNGTYLAFKVGISTLGNQLEATLYINGTYKIATNTTEIYNLTNQTGVFAGVLNTSGNQNYTTASIAVYREIYSTLLRLDLYLNGNKDSNSSILYGTASNITVTISNNTDFVTVYINGSEITVPEKSRTSYLSNMSAGLYRITAATNASGVGNRTYYERINKATPQMALSAPLGNFTYNGTVQTVLTSIITIDKQLSAHLYVNNQSYNSTHSNLTYTSASAGMYRFILNSSGNQNYTSVSKSLVTLISKAAPLLKIAVPRNFTYNGSSGISHFDIISINSQLSGILNLNGKAISSVPQFYLPIKIENNLSNSTPPDFQEEIIINSSKYKEYEAPALSNIKFEYPNGTIVNSWLESNNSYNSSHTIYWLKIGSIPPHNETTVYMLFLNKSTNVFNNNTIGEAPELSPSYGEYDDGANVFKFYNNFAGTSLSTAWLNLSSGVANYSVDNGLLTTSGSSSGDYVYIYSKDLFNYPAVFEWYSAPVNQTTADSNLISFGYSESSSSESLYLGSSNRLILSYATNSSVPSGLSSSPTVSINNTVNDNLYGISANGSTVTAYFDYSPKISEGEGYLPKSIPFSAVLNYQSGITSPKIFWVRVRTYPLNGVMPPAIIGNVSSEAVNLSESSVGAYIYNLSTSGNQNYTKASLRRSFSISSISTPPPVVPPPIINITPHLPILRIKVPEYNLTKARGSINITYSFRNYTETINISSYFPSYNFTVPLIENSTYKVNTGGNTLDYISIASKSRLSNASISISNPQTVVCYGSALNKVIKYYSILPSFNESNAINDSVIYLVHVNSSELSKYNLTPQDIGQYKCNVGTRGWEELPTYLVNSSSSGAYYLAYSNSMSVYATAAGSTTTNISSNIIPQIFYEAGLPSGRFWAVSYGGVNSSAMTGLPIVFNVPEGEYPFISYSYTNSSISATQECNTTYYPTNFKAGLSTVEPAGITITVNYAKKEYCAALPKVIPESLPDIFYGLLITSLISIILLLLVIIRLLLFRKRMYTKTAIRAKNKISKPKSKNKNRKRGIEIT